MSVVAATVIGLRLLAFVVTAGLAVYAWNRRTEPASVPFAGLMATIALWTLNSAISAFVFEPDLHVLLHRIRWLPIAVMPVFWIWFAVAYTGYDDYISPGTVGLVCAIPLVSIVLILTNPVHGLVWEIAIGELHGLPILEMTYGPWFTVIALYSAATLFVGTGLLLQLAVRSEYLYLDQAILLCVGSIVPWIAAVLSISGALFPPGIGITSVSFAVAGPAFGYALFRRRLFDLAPATRQLSRNSAIAALQEGVLILDDSFEVIYCNDRTAEIFDRDVESILGSQAETLVETDDVDFHVPDALSELRVGDRTYEARSSAITDRTGCTIGHTVIFADVTARKRRERLLQRQRDDLRLLDRLNAAVREITHEFVSATSRDEIEEIVRDRLYESELYTDVLVLDAPTDALLTQPDPDRGERAISPKPIRLTDRPSTPAESASHPEREDGDDEIWAFVPLGFGRTAYGGLAIRASRPDAFDERELAVLEWFGETVSQAINAVENRRVLFSGAVTELSIDCPNTPLQAVATETSCRLALEGFVPAGDDRALVYCDATTDASAVAAAAETIDEISSCRLVGDDPSAVVEFTLAEKSPLLAFVGGGAKVCSVRADERTCTIEVEVGSSEDARLTLERVREHCPDASLAAKRHRDRPPSIETNRVNVEALTDRQLEVLEAAYRGGYFRWPRDATAEELAESLGISSPTLHKHLRHAEARIFDELLDPDPETDGSESRE